MIWNLHPKTLLAIALGLAFARPAVAQEACPLATDRLVALAWPAYRADSVEQADRWFTAAYTLCRHSIEAQIGLGYTSLRLGRVGRADTLFRRAVSLDSMSADGWMGLAFVGERTGKPESAVRAAVRVLEIVPGHFEALDLLDRLDPDWNRPPVQPKTRAQRLQVQARTRGASFEVPQGSAWEPMYIRGVNLGVALPGRFPSQFPLDSATYAGWLDTLATMHANAVRVYTILPPSFYRALSGWNTAHPDKAIWLIHGVWTELPPRHDFNDAPWKDGFRQEMRRVVDLIHGSAELAPRPGHASGKYDTDVSQWVLAYIIGREWEPFAVRAFDQRYPNALSYAGRYLRVSEGTATDNWMAEQCDYLLSYEVDTYNAIRPIAYTNWPTLDPLEHPTEPNTDEELAWREIVDRPAKYIRQEYENDAVGLDATLVRPTQANPAGWFASYHAYPYYPDFMLYDDRYNQAASAEGRSNYFGYLERLTKHHSGIPLVIAEYGVPSSRGMAHLQPQGWHHGGHDEAAMAAIDARLTREIKESGAAGGILFAWLDEWFKHNWAVIDLEIPAGHNPRWLNVMDAEQQYGILGMYPGDSGATPVLGGDPAVWSNLSIVQQTEAMAQDSATTLHVGGDEAFLYLALALPDRAGRPFPWDSLGVYVALDTYRADLGQHRLPRGVVQSDIGFEFLVDLESPERGRLRVIPEYNPYLGPEAIIDGDERGAFYRRPTRTVARYDGEFDSLYVITNRARFGRDGTFFPATAYPRGELQYGSHLASTLSDWYFDEGVGLLELRLPWALLNVTDPSSARILYEETIDTTEVHPPFGTVESDGLRLGALVYRKGGRPTIVTAVPAVTWPARWEAHRFVARAWERWSVPTYHQRLKPVYSTLKALWESE
ncbi:MAG: hypothetical protein HKM89_05575 [Gemmatimonadales bacterium]|nr:hypothetical protein [Gemmatimonadales bacterium]